MSQVFGTGHLRFGTMFLVGLVMLMATLGCGNPATSQAPPAAMNEPAAQAPAEPVPTGPSEVELFEPTARIDAGNIFWFSVKYRFTKGAPRKHYLLAVNFPGTKNAGLKTMEAWELKSEGTIKDGIELHEMPGKNYEFVLSEADSPMTGYHVISNTLVAAWPPGSSFAAASEKESVPETEPGAKADDTPEAEAKSAAASEIP